MIRLSKCSQSIFTSLKVEVSLFAGMLVVSGSSSVFNGNGLASSLRKIVMYAPKVGFACCEEVLAHPEPRATFVEAKKYKYLPFLSHAGDIASAIGSLSCIIFLLSADHTIMLLKLLAS